MNPGSHEDSLTFYGRRFSSRLLLGTSRYESPRQLTEAIEAANPAMLTVSLRRQLSAMKDSGGSFWNLLRDTGRSILPNTAGCHTPREAINTALMARELFGTNLIKLEVIGDEVNLQPDPFGLVEAAAELVKLGFHVLPYCTEDWVLCRRLLDIGCEVLMPWAAPIGTGQGTNEIRQGCANCDSARPDIPLIVDAGLGLPSHACQVMEWGFDAVLLNTAVSRAIEPVRMASAFAEAVRAGRLGLLRDRWRCSRWRLRVRRRLDGRLPRRWCEAKRSADLVLQDSDSFDRDADDVAGCQGEVVRGDDASSGHQVDAHGEDCCHETGSGSSSGSRFSSASVVLPAKDAASLRRISISIPVVRAIGPSARRIAGPSAQLPSYTFACGR